MKPDSGYITYIINPKSGSKSSDFICHKFPEYLTKKGFDVRVSFTTSLDHACELATDAAVDYDCAMVIVAGGDGTVREVAHGLEGSDKPLLIIPGGTENILANELGINESPKTIIGMFEDGQTKSLDLGVANGKSFTSIAGFGFDGAVIKLVSQQREGHIDHLDYFWPIWRAFWNYKFDAIKVEVDGEEIFNGRGLVFVGNISTYAVGLRILNEADFGDGFLDICIYKCASRWHLLKHSVMTIFKRHVSGSDVIYRKGKKIIVSSKLSDIPTQIDGDPGPILPVKINVIPRAVNVIVPKNAKPAGIRTRIMRVLRK